MASLILSAVISKLRTIFIIFNRHLFRAGEHLHLLLPDHHRLVLGSELLDYVLLLLLRILCCKS